MTNPWKNMTYEDGVAMDKRKDTRPSVLVKRALLWKTIKRFLPHEPLYPILDLGGGTGVWAIRIAREGKPVILTDISPGLLDRAEEKIESEKLRHLITVKEADICNLITLPESNFRLILALGDPLSYCTDAERALKEIRRVTVNGGILIGDVENRYWSAKSYRRASTWQEAKMIFLEGKGYWPEMKDYPRIRQFTPLEIRKLLEDTGWTVLEMYPSDLMVNLLTDDMFNEICSSPSGMEEVISMEEKLRKDSSILGAGSEIQFVVSS